MYYKKKKTLGMGFKLSLYLLKGNKGLEHLHHLRKTTTVAEPLLAGCKQRARD